MVILQDRPDQPAWITLCCWSVTVLSLHKSPSIITSALLASRLKINFFPTVLADFADEYISGQTIKTKPPGVAQPKGPNFTPCPRRIHKRIIGGNAVRTAPVDTVYLDP